MLRNQGGYQIWVKPFANPIDAVNIRDTTGYTQLADLAPEDVQFSDEQTFQLNRTTAHRTSDRRVLITREFSVNANFMPEDLSELAPLVGMLDSDVEDKSGASPKYYQLTHGGQSTPVRWNMIIRRQRQTDRDLWEGYFIYCAEMNISGQAASGEATEGKVPVLIQAFTLTSGTHADKIYGEFQEYEYAAPVIVSIADGGNLVRVADLVVINGYGFGKSRGASVVTFNSAKVAVIYEGWTDNQIVVQIPAASTTGLVTVTVHGETSAGVALSIA